MSNPERLLPFWTWLRDSRKGDFVLSKLLVGSVGRSHLIDLAAHLFGAESFGPERLGLAGSLLLAAWEAAPLDQEAAAQVLTLDGRVFSLERQFRGLLKAICRMSGKPENSADWLSVRQTMDMAALREFLERRLAAEPDNAFWLQAAWEVALASGDLLWLDSKYATAFTQQHDLLLYFKGCLLLLQCSGNLGESKVQTGLDQAARLFRSLADRYTPEEPRAGSAPATEPWLAPLELYAHCAAGLGNLPEAAAAWRRILRHRPWHANLVLRAYDALAGSAAAAKCDWSDTALLFYSHNKSADLHAALQSIAPAAGRFRHVYVLDNGSVDGTSDLLASWQERLGPALFTPIFLPVNIGAPAARNWLAKTAREADYLLYLDDDAQVAALHDARPEEWLAQLGRACGLYPRASSWGLKIRDYHLPWQAQSVDLHLYQVGNGFNLCKVHGQTFALSDLHSQTPDFGQFSYIRPCLSVTGCCHLLPAGAFKAGYFFDLKFSPSQYDDLVYDLSGFERGGQAVFCGLTSVYHRKRTGKGSRMSSAQYGNGLANRYKLYAQFSQGDLDGFLLRQNELLYADICRKAEFLDETLG